MTTVHLDMMELERHGQSCLEPTFAIPAPSQERIIELAAVLVYDAVNLCLYNGRCSYNHIVLKGSVLAFIGSLSSHCLIVTGKLLYIIRITRRISFSAEAEELSPQS